MLGDGMVELELADLEVGIRLIGTIDVVRALIADAERLLADRHPVPARRT